MRFKLNTWYHTGGDVNPAQHGGVFCSIDEFNRVTCIELDALDDCEDGPWCVTQIDVDDADLRTFLGNESARASMDFPPEWTPTMRLTTALRFAIAEDFVRYQGASWQGEVSIVSSLDELPFEVEGMPSFRGRPLTSEEFRRAVLDWVDEYAY